MHTGETPRPRTALSLNSRLFSFESMRKIARDDLRAWMLRLIRYNLGRLKPVRVTMGCGVRWLYEVVRDLDLWPDIIAARNQRRLNFGMGSVGLVERMTVPRNGTLIGMLAAIRPYEAREKVLDAIKRHNAVLANVAIEFVMSERQIYNLINTLGLKNKYAELKAEARRNK